jgi:tetratricopeptide (TPR) repeat protein
MDTNADKNSYELYKLSLAIKHTSNGFFCYTTATATEQSEAARQIREIAAPYEIACIDASRDRTEFSLRTVYDMVKEHPTAKAYIICNLQAYVPLEKEARIDFFSGFNMSRDPWARLNKLFILGMTKGMSGDFVTGFKREFANEAPDFNSFFLNEFHFEFKLPEDIVQPRVEYINEPRISEGAVRNANSRFKEMVAKITTTGVETEWSESTERFYLDFLRTWSDSTTSFTDESDELVKSVLSSLCKWSDSWSDTIITADKYDELYKTYYRLNQYTDALKMLEKQLYIHEKILGEGHFKTAIIYDNIAEVYHNDQGDYVKALEWYNKALVIHERSGNEYGTVIIYNNIASTYHNQGDYSKALEWYNKALVIYERLGYKYSTANAYSGIAAVYHDQGDYAKALEWYNKALDIYERLADGYPIANIYEDIAIVYHSQGDYPKALEWYLKCYKIYINIYGENYPYAEATYNRMKSIYSKLDLPEPFEEWLRKQPAD